MNIVDAVDTHSDDLPSRMHDSGYRTGYFSSSDPSFDGFQNWIYRRSAEEEAKNILFCDDAIETIDDPYQLKLMKMPKLRKCSKEEVELKAKGKKSFPKWFDYISYYYPSENQSKALNISKKDLKKQIFNCDRILGKQYIYHWKQQMELMKRKNISKPLFAFGLNSETHIPYMGFDLESNYEQISPKISKFSPEHKKYRFLRVNKYSDKHFIKNIVEFLKEEYNNTIVAVVGDHGTRDVPILKNNKITNKTFFDSECANNPSGIDSLFITSGTIFYLGDNQKVKEALKLDKLKGKTLKLATDINDLSYTLIETIARIRNTNVPPTNRLSRNLIDYTSDIMESLEMNGTANIVKMIDDGWKSLAYISHQMEYRRGTKVLRTHTSGPEGSHYYDIGSFPTCIKRKNHKSHELGGSQAQKMFNEMYDYLNVLNYLTAQNRIFNYDFRDDECVKKGKCQLPNQLEPNHVRDSNFFIFVGLTSFGISLILTIIFQISRSKFINEYHNKVVDELKSQSEV